MARYKVLQSIAHNQAHSFVSAMNYWNRDYVACYLLRASRDSGLNELDIDLLTGLASPPPLLGPEVAASLKAYCENFQRLVATGGAARDMITIARMTVRVEHGLRMGANPGPTLHARLRSQVTIIDDRGKEHFGEHLEPWECGIKAGAV